MILLNKFKMFFNSPVKMVNNLKNTGTLGISGAIILIASSFNGFVAPVLSYLVHRNEFKVTLDPYKMILVFLVSILTFLIACATLIIISRLAGSSCSLRTVISTWGISYIPTLLCSVVVIIYECTFYYFIGNTLLLLLLNTIFLLLLIWKAIFYFIEAHIVLGLRGYKLAVATVAVGVIFAVLIFVNMRVGLMVPML